MERRNSTNNSKKIQHNEKLEMKTQDLYEENYNILPKNVKMGLEAWLRGRVPHSNLSPTKKKVKTSINRYSYYIDEVKYCKNMILL
jgi:hypothetical protein